MSDEFDVAIHDVEALAEIELLTDLIIATSESGDRLPASLIDEILGVGTPDASASRASAGDGSPGAVDTAEAD